MRSFGGTAWRPIIGLLLVQLALQGCSSGITRPSLLPSFDVFGSSAPRTTGSYHLSAPKPLKVGVPYVIKGRLYVPRYEPGYDKVGVASWYGGKFIGRPTANGEIFDTRAMTAAHPTLPLNSVVRVTNLENGRSVVVRINDRGPFIDNRIIDMSRRGAELLGFERDGLARVRVTVIGPNVNS